MKFLPNMSKKWSTIALGCTALLLAGCGPEAPPPATDVGAAGIVWPAPPEQPRIKFIRSLSSKDDVDPDKSKSKLADMLLGEDDKAAKGLQKPYGVAADSRGRVFVTDTAAAELVVFDVENKKHEIWGTDGAGSLRLPLGVAVDSQDRVYVSDGLDKRVVVFDDEGNFLRAFGGEAELGNPVGLAINESLGRVYVVDSKQHRIAVYDEEGALLTTFGERGGATGQFNFPANVAIDGDGTLYVSDAMNFRVQVLDPDGKALKVFGKTGRNLGQFSRPKGIGVDSKGHIYVVDSAFSNFQIFDQDGELLMFVGDGGTGPGQFSLPAGMYIDGKDRIYVVDQVNLRVQVFQYLGGDDEEVEVAEAING